MCLHLGEYECFHIYYIFLEHFLLPSFHGSLHNNMLVFYVPTIIVLKYTNLLHYPSKQNTFYHILKVWILLFHFLRLHLQVLLKVPFLQTIALKCVVLLYCGICNIFLHYVCNLLFLLNHLILLVFQLFFV